MSEENIAMVVAELIDGEVVVVANDVAAAQSVRVLRLPLGLVSGQRWNRRAGTRTRSNPAPVLHAATEEPSQESQNSP